MLDLIWRRLLQMVLIMASVAFLLFAIFDSDQFRKQVAVAELGGFGAAALSESDYQAWIVKKGLDKPFIERYVAWAGNMLRGEMGFSLEKNVAVSDLIASRLYATGKLALYFFALTIPISLLLGVIAGMREGSRTDRVISIFSVVTTSVPQIATAVLLTVFLSLGLGWFPAKSTSMGPITLSELALPVLTLMIYDVGYVARMTRASMVEVMSSHYIRTAVLKGLPRAVVIWRHALRNALIVPVTLIFLQLNWLLSHIVVVEVFFQYSGFGRMLYEAAMYGDAEVVQAATMVAVIVAVLSQLLSDISYVLLNPRLRVAR